MTETLSHRPLGQEVSLLPFFPEVYEFGRRFDVQMWTGYAMTEGYVVVDAGWEGDVIPTPSKLVASLPRARNANGTPIIGQMRYEYSDRAAGSFTTNLEGNAAFLSYEAADTNTAHATFTVADRPSPEPSTVTTSIGLSCSRKGAKKYAVAACASWCSMRCDL